MSTLVLGPPPPELEALMDRRRRWGADRHDEVWEGVCHMVPSPSYEHSAIVMQLGRLLGPLADAAGLTLTAEFNLGESKDDLRVPDVGLHRPGASGTWLNTAAVAVEIRSPHDETRQKLPFHAAHQVDEVVIVDPEARTVEWLARRGGRHAPVEASGLIDTGADALAGRIAWP